VLGVTAFHEAALAVGAAVDAIERPHRLRLGHVREPVGRRAAGPGLERAAIE